MKVCPIMEDTKIDPLFLVKKTSKSVKKDRKLKRAKSILSQ